MRLTKTLASAALCAFTTLSRAALPESAPVVTVGANLKQLQFDWAQVPRSNTYELWFKANDQAPWIKYTEMSPRDGSRFRINVSVHLLDWRVARYRVAACNPGGCKNSAELVVSGLAPDAIGYIKPTSNVATNQWFGYAVALSADGLTLAVLTGETVGYAINTAVVNVYRRKNSGAPWRREARFAPSTLQTSTALNYLGKPLALSGDGNLLALGLPTERPTAAPPYSTGAVYLFRRDGVTWSQEQKIPGATTSLNYFGVDVDVDDAGDTLAVGRNTSDEGPSSFGTVDIFHHGGSGWQRTTSLPAPREGNVLGICRGNSLSGDGRTLVRSCALSGQTIVQVFQAPDWALCQTLDVAGQSDRGGIDVNGDGTRLAVEADGIRVFDKSSGAWLLDGHFDGPVTATFATRSAIAISRDGKLLALGNAHDDRAGTGLAYPGDPESPGNRDTGTVVIYERKSSGWSVRRIIKANTPTPQWFGNSVALGDFGRVLAVGAPFDESAATGIDGDQTDTSSPWRGAVWLY
ncbi:MAG TPA: hypothetical protein VFL16_09505 [Steroidobacteraceae bacterium]|nr:hypothetical protein [Steroidobacteraceae bacterium]